ncbi:glyoxalase [Nitrogeniibacter mangrovi]|uniref:Glyoxalase n=1 Tax=Nitrogeniibacter mangrovi TaxID=2016596 RepID=A0A6C1BB39_9RHOO|nr:glyoxalase [Nitrogeniibacter mangrovi]QID19620.1 glyoxalase [Nitrogeniibacter mangrovi]
MSRLDAIALLPRLPALNFARSQRFYLDLGFRCVWANATQARFECGATAFLLGDDYMAVVAENTRVQLEVRDVDAWWSHVHDSRLADIHDVRLGPVDTLADGARAFTLTDPSGVLWRIVQRPAAD